MSAKITRSITLIVLCLLALAPAVLFPGGLDASPGGSGLPPQPAIEWSLEARLVVPHSEIAEGGAETAVRNRVHALESKLNAQGIPTEKHAVAVAGHDMAFDFRAFGKSELKDFRRLIHRTARPQFSLLGGVAEMEIESNAPHAPELVLILESNPSTGYRWMASPESGMREQGPSAYVKHTRFHGAPQRQIIRLARSNGGGPIRLVYRRPWEAVQPTRLLKLHFPDLPEKLDLSDPDAPEGTVSAPEGTVYESLYPVLSDGVLPLHFDWRDRGIVPAVRDQQYCGSCWAHAVAGIMESSLWKNGLANKNLSEQFLVSCNTDGSGCDGGNLDAHKYHYDTSGLNQTDIGAVYEADKPYTATDGACPVNYAKHHRLAGWQFIGDPDAVPTVEQIKSAIYTYGPVAVGVCAGDFFDFYYGGSPGIFSTDESAQCGGGTNHAVILVGWDDPGQYWIMRNSWGTWWGIGGYMHIRYGTSRIGEGPTWVATDLPTASFSINGGAEFTRSAAVTLSFSTSIPNGTGVQVQLSNDGVAWTGWQAYAPNRSWTLPAGDGPKTVYAQFRFAGGSISDVFEDGITLDGTPPVDGTFTLARLAGSQVRFDWGGFFDAGSGIAEYRLFSSTAGAPANCAGTLAYSGLDNTFTGAIPAVARTGYYRLCAYDRAGNASAGITGRMKALGDVNDDGVVNVADAVLALRVLAGVATSTVTLAGADVDGDGRIGAADLIYILQTSAGIR